MEIVPTVAVLVIKNGRVLLVRHTEEAGHLTGVYGLPSGRIDKDESEKEAALRELSEETGLISSEGDLVEFPNNYYIAVIDRKGGEKVRFGWRVFLCTNWTGEIKESDETIPEWVEIDQMEDRNLLPNTRNATMAGLKFLK